MIRLFLLSCFVCFGISFVQAQSIKLPQDCKRILVKRFQSWRIAKIESSIIDYFKRDRSFEQPDLIRGDWNGDGKTDYAVLLENEKDPNKKITIALIKSRSSYSAYILDGYDCIMSMKKGDKDYNFETRKTFRYKRDAIFTYHWEKGGDSFVFEKGKFRAILTSD